MSDLKLWFDFYRAWFISLFAKDSVPLNGVIGDSVKGTVHLERRRVYLTDDKTKPASVFKGTIRFLDGSEFQVMEDAFADQHKPDGAYKIVYGDGCGIRLSNSSNVTPFFLFTTQRKAPEAHNIVIGNKYALVLNKPVMYNGGTVITQFEKLLADNEITTIIIHTKQEEELWTSV